ncbi:MAG: hypothetical protein COA43_14505 [Robiginitomaculum sp.]|nr:MAG: hypothetical protein COA43_14505 [Robiginitomaculum sp.]
MSWLGKLFGTEKAVSSLIDKDNGLLVQAGNWIGGFSYTAEEKAENNLLVKQWGLKQLEALEPFKVVQRIIAFSVLFLWAFVGVNYVVMLWLEHPQIDKLLKFAMSDYVFWPTLAVLSLYCGGGTLNSFTKK